MAIRLEIYTVFDAGPEKDQIEASMAALGFERRAPTLRQIAEAAHDAGFKVDFQIEPKAQSSAKIAEQEVAAATERVSGEDWTKAGDTNTPDEAPAARRERGKPSPGKARRTKEEIAEDEAADKADAENIVDESGESSGMSISSGEERISPEDEADAAQDAADEAAETERNGGMSARERLRKALGSLGIKAGVEAVKPGGLIGMTIDQVPEDEIEAMIAKIEAAKTSPTITQETIDNVKRVEEEMRRATKDDLMQAMLDYAEVFDGTRNPSEAKLAQVDAGEVFKMLFGEGVSKLSAVPADGYDKAIAGIKEAIEKNPFKRERKA
jgi:hypothetical protein